MNSQIVVKIINSRSTCIIGSRVPSVTCNSVDTPDVKKIVDKIFDFTSRAGRRVRQCLQNSFSSKVFLSFLVAENGE